MVSGGGWSQGRRTCPDLHLVVGRKRHLRNVSHGLQVKVDARASTIGKHQCDVRITRKEAELRRCKIINRELESFAS